MTVGALYRRSRRMGEWLHANGAKIRHAEAAGDRAAASRLLTLQRQRTPIYDAAYARFWEAWMAAQDTHRTHADGQETVSAPVRVPRGSGPYGALTEAEMMAAIEKARVGPLEGPTLYEEMTGEKIEVALARNAAEVEWRVSATHVDNRGNAR